MFQEHSMDNLPTLGMQNCTNTIKRGDKIMEKTRKNGNSLENSLKK